MNFSVLLIVLISLLIVSNAFKLSTSRKSTSSLNMLKVGEIAPDFELLTSKGTTVKLSSFKGKKPVVVFFYPADNSPGCTKQVIAFEKKSPDFKSKGAEVFGVSSQGKAEKEKFIKTTSASSTTLLIDDGEKVRKAWDVPRALFGAFPGRVTYVIGRDGTVKGLYDDLANAELHPVKALDILEKTEAVAVPEKKKNIFGL